MNKTQLPSHIQWLVEHRGSALKKALSREHLSMSVEEALSILMDADPSQKKLAVQWLADTYIAKGFRWEDVRAGADSKAADTLRLLGFNRQYLSGPERNLSYHQSLGSLYTCVKQFVKSEEDEERAMSPGIRAQRRAEREQAMQESKILYRSDSMIVAVPLSVEASKWWGRGTQWCTAAENDNAFLEYHQAAPLIVMVFPKGLKGARGTKFQMYVDADTFMFMDENDSEISHRVIEDNWDVLGKMILWASKKNVEVFVCVPDNFKTSDMYYNALKSDNIDLWNIPKKHCNNDIYMLALQKDPGNLGNIPKNKITQEMCDEATKHKNWDLYDIPIKYRTYEICLKFVKMDTYGLNYVPKQHRTEEICNIAVRSCGSNLEYVPVSVRTPEMCALAVSQGENYWSYVPKTLKNATQEIVSIKYANIHDEDDSETSEIPNISWNIDEIFTDIKF